MGALCRSLFRTSCSLRCFWSTACVAAAATSGLLKWVLWRAGRQHAGGPEQVVGTERDEKDKTAVAKITHNVKPCATKSVINVGSADGSGALSATPPHGPTTRRAVLRRASLSFASICQLEISARAVNENRPEQVA